jgi:hypothetical protein
MPLLRTGFKNPLAALNASRICFGSLIIEYSPILDSSLSIPHVGKKQLSFACQRRRGPGLGGGHGFDYVNTI